MGLFSPELSLDIVHALDTAASEAKTFPKTITDFIAEVSREGHVSEKLSKLDDFVKRLEDERKKIEVFKRELPLCMLLLTDAILALKEESSKLNVQPILKEFIPLENNCDYDEDKVMDLEETGKVDYVSQKNWMSSVQLWCSTDDDDEKLEADLSFKQISKPDDESLEADLSFKQISKPNEESLEADLSSKQISEPDNKKKNVLEEEDKATSEDSLKLRTSDDFSKLCRYEDKATSEDISKLCTSDDFSKLCTHEDSLKLCISHNTVKAFEPLEKSADIPLILQTKEDSEKLPMVPALSYQTPVVKKLKEDLGCIDILNSTLIGNRSISSCITSVKRAVNQSQCQTSRKQRRCWSPELHRQFVDALQQLGGCQAATPKQIRDLMKVEGLTNDEVKSHLQKYRLHTRRIPSSANDPLSSSSNGVIVFDGLWTTQERGESSKHSISQFESPQNHLQLGGVFNVTSMTESNSMEEEDENSNGHSWKTEDQLIAINL